MYTKSEQEKKILQIFDILNIESYEINKFKKFLSHYEKWYGSQLIDECAKQSKLKLYNEDKSGNELQLYAIPTTDLILQLKHKL